MSVIAAAYSYTALSISQTSTAAADVGTKSSTASVFSRSSSSAPDASVTTVSISYRAKLLLARASADDPSSTSCRHSSMPLAPAGRRRRFAAVTPAADCRAAWICSRSSAGPVTTASWFTPATPRSMPARATMWLCRWPGQHRRRRGRRFRQHLWPFDRGWRLRR